MTGNSRIALFPRLSWAALKANEEVDFVAWSVLREHSAHALAGCGNLSWDEAVRVLRDWRPSLSRQSVPRILIRLSNRGYVVLSLLRGKHHVWLASVGRLMLRFDVPFSGIPHTVPVHRLTTRAEMRAHLYATVRPLPNDSGEFSGGIFSRKLIEDLTGTSARAQQIYDNKFGITQLVQDCYALIENHEGPLRVGAGYFADAQGRQWRRLPDLRTPVEHWRGSRSASRHAARRARELRGRSEYSRVPEGLSYEMSPVGNWSSGIPERFERTYQFGRTEGDARDKHARQCDYCAPGRQETCTHGGIVAYGKPGKLRFALREGSR